MGGNKRRHKKRKEVVPPTPCTEGDETNHGDDDHRIVVHLECAKDVNPLPPPVWSTEFVEHIEKKLPSGNVPSVTDVGLQLVRGTLEKISSRRYKKVKSKNSKGSNQSSSVNIDTTSVAVKPTPIQLRMWPALLHSFQRHDKSMNVVGIAPTGTGKTMSYSIPIISHCVRTLLLCYHRTKHQHNTITKHTNNSTMVHGIVLVPTRELAIQVSKEIHSVAKVANKYLSKYCLSFKDDNGDDASDTTTIRVDSLPIYGGVDIGTQIASIVGSSLSSNNHETLLVLAATAGRLLDILKQTSHQEESSSTVAEVAFSNLQAIVFDEADRIAVNSDMASDVDEILTILKNVRMKNITASTDAGTKGGILSCLVSATLPAKAKEVCEKWVPKTRVVVKVDSVNVGDKKQLQKLDFATKTSNESKGSESGDNRNDEVSSKKMPSDADDQDKEMRYSAQNLDLASIPSNIVQTLHVCSSHKKPKKLILTLQRIYMKKKTDTKSRWERFSANNRLTIVFFSQIKTVKYVSKLLVKEGLRCVELYGSLQQSDREKRLLEFRAGKTPILLATDVAARGIHISNVNYVVNYDFPGSLDQYVHRCGRAGRKQFLSGEVSQYPPTVYSFFPREFSAMADSVIELLKACNAWVDPNLLALSNENKLTGKKSSSEVQRKKRKREHNNTNSNGGKERRKATKGSEDSVELDDDDIDQFSFLGKCVLKRASHASDAEDDSDNDDC